MVVRGLTIEQIESIVDSMLNIAFKLQPKKIATASIISYRFTLTVQNSKGPCHKTGVQGRRVAALCWHGYKEFIQPVYEINPNAKVRTSLTFYTDKTDFEENSCVENIYTTHSQEALQQYSKACECNEQNKQ